MSRIVQGFTPLDQWEGASSKTGLVLVHSPASGFRLSVSSTHRPWPTFDIRVPGLDMTVDPGGRQQCAPGDGGGTPHRRRGNLRRHCAQPAEDPRLYGIFAETMGRTASVARGTLAPREGMAAEVSPNCVNEPRLTMADMGMDHGNMAGMDHSNMPGMDQGKMPGMDHSNMPGMGQGKMPGMDHSKMPGMDHSNMTGVAKKDDPFYASGSGLLPTAANGGKVLSYSDLKAQKPLYKDREATREIELRLTGNMERYIWSINGIKYKDAEPIVLQYGERVRFKFVNETMMTHPMHLHGMWSILDNGNGKWDPVKHTISVAPGSTVYSETEVDAPGQWAFHCHLSYHADAGMFRKIVVEGGPKAASLMNKEGGKS